VPYDCLNSKWLVADMVRPHRTHEAAISDFDKFAGGLTCQPYRLTD